jgi:formylglycine-generating enzyme required for sulfatase activity
MSGNVREWCWDGYEVYPNIPQIDPKGSSGKLYKVLRGGSYNSSENFCRVACRHSQPPNWKSYDTGFRIVRKK